MSTATAPFRPKGPTGLQALRITFWVSVAVVASVVTSICTVLGHRGFGGPNLSDVALISGISAVMWLLCLLPTAWLIHSRLGRRIMPALWYDARRLAWYLHDLWSNRPVNDSREVDVLSPTGFTSIEDTYYKPRYTPTTASDFRALGDTLPAADTDVHRDHGVKAVTSKTGFLTIPRHLRTSRPDSLMLNGYVEPLESDGDVLTAPWAVGAFFDIAQHGITGVELDSGAALLTARKDTLDIGVRIAAEIVGTKIPSRLRERLEQRQFLVTACVLKHFDASSADAVRAMLLLRGYDPQMVWGAADAYLSGYYHCGSWDAARSMSARQLRLPPPPRV
ncbi:MAG: hypothetical protein ACR2M1_07665 [Gemmatimonadaceae bacterium]